MLACSRPVHPTPCSSSSSLMPAALTLGLFCCDSSSRTRSFRLLDDIILKKKLVLLLLFFLLFPPRLPTRSILLVGDNARIDWDWRFSFKTLGRGSKSLVLLMVPTVLTDEAELARV